MGSQGFSNRGGNTSVHVAAAPQIVLEDTLVCVWRELTRTPNTHQRVLQLVVAAGDPPVRGYCPYSLKSLFLFPPTTPKRRKSMFCGLGATAPKPQNMLFLRGKGSPPLSATFEKP